MIRVVVLAAGKGKRMGASDLPKVLRPLLGKPLLWYALEAIADSGVDAKPVLVVGHLAERVIDICGNACEYARQAELRGTGDAVRTAQPLLEGVADHVLVMNGDQPLVTGGVIRKIADMHLASNAVLTMGTVEVPDFEGWRAGFADFGRVERDAAGKVKAIVEVKDANEAQKAIRELNPSLFCFRADWLWEHLERLTTENAQGEYYLTGLVELAIRDDARVVTVPVPAEAALGVNTPEQLAEAEAFLKSRDAA